MSAKSKELAALYHNINSCGAKIDAYFVANKGKLDDDEYWELYDLSGSFATAANLVLLTKAKYDTQELQTLAKHASDATADLEAVIDNLDKADKVIAACSAVVMLAATIYKGDVGGITDALEPVGEAVTALS